MVWVGVKNRSQFCIGPYCMIFSLKIGWLCIKKVGGVDEYKVDLNVVQLKKYKAIIGGPHKN